MDNTIQIIESRIDLINSKADLYYPTFFSQNNDGCSHKLSHIIGEFVPMKKQHDILYGFKSQFSLSWKVVSIQGGIIGRRHFHQLKMNSYLHQKYHLEKGPYYLSNETEGSM